MLTVSAEHFGNVCYGKGVNERGDREANQRYLLDFYSIIYIYMFFKYNIYIYIFNIIKYIYICNI